MQVPKATVATTGNGETLTKFGHVSQNSFLVFIQNFGAHRHPQDDVITIFAGSLFAHSGLAVFGKKVLLVAKVDQRVQSIHDFNDHVAAAPAVAPIRTTVFNVLFAPEGHCTAAAAAGSDIYFGKVEEFHDAASLAVAVGKGKRSIPQAPVAGIADCAPQNAMAILINMITARAIKKARSAVPCRRFARNSPK